MGTGPVGMSAIRPVAVFNESQTGNNTGPGSRKNVEGRADKGSDTRKPAAEGKKNNNELTDAEKRKLSLLKKSDRAVKAHEMAHVAAGGRYVRRGARYQYEAGPDGQFYAIAGDVSIDASEVPGDPKATAEKMGVVARAALAPKDPSAQDRKVAARAGIVRAEALMKLALLQVKEKIGAAEGKSDFTRSSGIEKYQDGGGSGREAHGIEVFA